MTACLRLWAVVFVVLVAACGADRSDPQPATPSPAADARSSTSALEADLEALLSPRPACPPRPADGASAQLDTATLRIMLGIDPPDTDPLSDEDCRS